jgi:hypothetical protein
MILRPIDKSIQAIKMIDREVRYHLRSIYQAQVYGYSPLHFFIKGE